MSDREFEAELTLKDRLNFPYLLANQILTFQKAILALEYSEREIRETIEGFEHMIPASWKDDQFNKDIEDAEITRKIDVRPEFCGVKPSLECCKENGLTAFKDEVILDYYAMFQACIDLLDRRGLTARRTFTEKFTGKVFKGNNVDTYDEG